MADPYTGEIRIFAGNYAPNGWAFCNGQLMPVSNYPALFSVLGTRYGGNGTTNFALPNMMGCVPMHQGAGQGLTPRIVGAAGGSDSVTLITNEMPLHSHQVKAASKSAQSSPANAVWSKTAGRRGTPAYVNEPPNVNMHAEAIGAAGGSQPHNNMQPYLALHFIICIDGIYPPRQ
ncbi:phage tail protein [Paenibacillus sp. MBLB4367]|uniref:phage tail protein n=1 Tax=Paenibacillus sp. MBLB4367 TaxID=3384767 RepID=UPI00390809D5